MKTSQYIFWGLLIAGGIAVIVYQFLKMKKQNQKLSGKKQFSPETLPNRLRAYERLAILLERLNPNNFLVQKIEPNQTCLEFQARILNDIRREFEHNASQQIYVSEILWEEIDDAREDIVQLINISAAQCKPDDPAEILAKLIIQAFNTPHDTAVFSAMRSLKAEVKELL